MPGLLALAWWAAWVFDPRNLGPGLLFAVMAAAQVLDLFVVLGFWHAIWPRRRPQPLFAQVLGRGSLLVLTQGEPVQVVEQTLKAAVAVSRRQQVFLADPFQRPELEWLAGWYGARRLSPEMEELEELAGARFFAVIEAGQVPHPDFLERLLPYFADRNLALVQAWCGRTGRRRPGVRDAILRGGDAVGVARCLGSNYVLRRSALQSVGGFGPSAASQAAALRLAAALRAAGWRTRYVSEQLADSLGSPAPRSRLADGARRALAELVTGLRLRGASASARFHAAWSVLRYPARVGLPVSALAVAGYAALVPVPSGWARNLALHLVPYLVLRAAIRVVAAGRPPAQELPLLQHEAAPTGQVESPQLERPEERRQEAVLPEVREPVPGAEPELHGGWPALSAPEPEPAPEVASAPAPRQSSLWDRKPGRPPRTRRTAVTVAAAWIVTTGAIGGAALAVIKSNPPQPPAQIRGAAAPPYSYYAPVQPPGAAQPPPGTP